MLVSEDDEVRIVHEPGAKVLDINTAEQQQADGDAIHVDLAEDEVSEPVEEQHNEQQQGEQQQQEQRGMSPEAAAALGWQFNLPLDGSVSVSEQQLLELLPVFHSVHAEECQDCAASLQEAAAGHQEVKQQLDTQRAAFGKLLNGNVQEVLQPGVTYYLVPK